MTVMKSPDPLDPIRLEVISAATDITQDRSSVLVSVVFRYDPWEPSPAQDVLREHARAMDCVREVLERGGIGENW